MSFRTERPGFFPRPFCGRRVAQRGICFALSGEDLCVAFACALPPHVRARFKCAAKGRWARRRLSKRFLGAPRADFARGVFDFASCRRPRPDQSSPSPTPLFCKTKNCSASTPWDSSLIRRVAETKQGNDGRVPHACGGWARRQLLKRFLGAHVPVLYVGL